jgi:mevalonate kinase
MILKENSQNKTYSCTSPGSIIILGEHSILRNHRAHILAIDKTLTVSLSLLKGKAVESSSFLFGGRLGWGDPQNDVLQNGNADTSRPLPESSKTTHPQSLRGGEACAAISHPTDHTLSIKSKLGEYKTTLENIQNTPANLFPKEFKYILAAIKYYLSKNYDFSNCSNIDLDIQSDIPHDYGLGSSGAVLSAIVGVISFCHGKIDANPSYSQKLELLQDAKNIAKTLSPNKKHPGSGYDYAASIFGGFIDYQTIPGETPVITHYEFPFYLILAYCGYKTDTSIVIDKVNKLEEANPEKFKDLYSKMHGIVLEGSECLREFSDKYSSKSLIESSRECLNESSSEYLKDSGDKNLTRYLELCEEYQSLLRELGVSDDTIESIIDVIREASSKQQEIAAQAAPARNDDTVYCKISGAGLGDCVIGLSERKISNKIISKINKLNLITL